MDKGSALVLPTVFSWCGFCWTMWWRTCNGFTSYSGQCAKQGL